ncbi:MAG: hypothetical protein HOK54_15910 [Alphaproteobacteria bacterium]|nr:hypothetical protein [Alphaproteobacteria bacterium]
MRAILILATLATFLALTAKAGAGEPPAVTRFDGVWDSYGGISCRRGTANPEALTIRNGTVTGTIDTTDNGNRMVGKIDAFGRMIVYVNGTYTIMTFKATLIGHEGYGPAEAIGDDVDCTGAWALRRRADPSIKDLHRTGDGATARISPDFVSRALSWNGQREFEKLYEVFTRRAENDRLKSLMSR